MQYFEAVTDTTAHGASQSELDRWDMYGDCSAEEFLGVPSVTEVNPNHISPHLNRFDKLLRGRELGQPVVASLVQGNRQ